MGLISSLYLVANVLWGCLYVKILQRQKKMEAASRAKDAGPEENGVRNGHASINIAKDDADKESTI